MWGGYGNRRYEVAPTGILSGIVFHPELLSSLTRLHVGMESVEPPIVRDESVQKPDLLEPGL